MKKALLYPVLAVFLMLPGCNTESEEELYYEPLVEGTFNISVDTEQSLDFTIEPNKAVSVEGQFDNGIRFKVEFEARANQFNETVEASIQPVTGISDMPSDFQFHFGFVFSPEGVNFIKPGKMTIELPAGMDVGELKGFFFQGGVPYGTADAEIWSVKLTPMLFQSVGGKNLAVLELPHFSGFLGVSGGEFKCGNPLAAELCEELKEILACYITGNESISADVMKKVNKALADWIDAGLDWLEEHPEELENLWDVEDAIKELLCWKSAVLMFNSNMAPFQDQLDRVGNLFTQVLIDRLVSSNEECLSMSDMYAQYGAFETNAYFMNLMDELRKAGFLNEDPEITLHSYCDEIATNFYLEPMLDTARNDIRFEDGMCKISLGAGEDAIARSASFTVYAKNLLGELIEMVPGEDYTIQNVSTLWHTLNGNTVTELIQTCYDVLPDGTTCCPHPCYMKGGYCSFRIYLNTSGDRLDVRVERFGW